MSTYNLCFEQQYKKDQIFLSEKFPFDCKIFNLFEYACFRKGMEY